jgi:hypothetical protein
MVGTAGLGSVGIWCCPCQRAKCFFHSEWFCVSALTSLTQGLRSLQARFQSLRITARASSYISHELLHSPSCCHQILLPQAPGCCCLCRLRVLNHAMWRCQATSARCVGSRRAGRSALSAPPRAPAVPCGTLGCSRRATCVLRMQCVHCVQTIHPDKLCGFDPEVSS